MAWHLVTELDDQPVHKSTQTLHSNKSEFRKIAAADLLHGGSAHALGGQLAVFGLTDGRGNWPSSETARRTFGYNDTYELIAIQHLNQTSG